MKKKLSFFIKGLTSFILLYLIVRKLGISQLVGKLSEGEIDYLFAGISLGLICNAIKLFKWSYLVNSTIKSSFWDNFKSYTLGNSFGLVTPLRAGELGRALYYQKEHSSYIVGLTIFDRGLDVTAVLVLSVAGSFALFGPAFGSVITLSAVFATVSLFKSNFILEIIRRMLPDRLRKARVIEFLNSLDRLDISYVSISLGLSLLAFMLSIIELYFLILAFEKVTITAVFLSIPMMSLSNVLPISIMGLGVREGVAFYLLSQFGVSGYASVSAAFLSFIVNNLLLGITGVFFISKIKVLKSGTVSQYAEK